VWNDADKAVGPETLQRMIDALHHRGSDDEGTYSGQWSVAMGHRRLSIIDIAGGQQLLSNEDDSVWVVFNGEIFNYRELLKIPQYA